MNILIASTKYETLRKDLHRAGGVKPQQETTAYKLDEDKAGMRYQHFAAPRRLADLGPIERNWCSLGWQPLDNIDEMLAIRAAWAAKFGDYGLWGTDPVFSPPSRSWDISLLYPWTDRSEAIEAEFTLKMLAAFRRSAPKGERLQVIGHWQLEWYEFDPHGGVSAATCDEWARPILTVEPIPPEPNEFLRAQALDH